MEVVSEIQYLKQHLPVIPSPMSASTKGRSDFALKKIEV